MNLNLSHYSNTIQTTIINKRNKNSNKQQDVEAKKSLQGHLYTNYNTRLRHLFICLFPNKHRRQQGSTIIRESFDFQINKVCSYFIFYARLPFILFIICVFFYSFFHTFYCNFLTNFTLFCAYPSFSFSDCVEVSVNGMEIFLAHFLYFLL